MKIAHSGLGGIEEGEDFDVIVVGAGGAGLSAALFAAIEGAKVLIVECTEYVGGTTAWSAGTTWVPGTAHGQRVNPQDTLAAAAEYLDNAVGERSSAAVRHAFLAHGAEAVAHVEANSEVKYRPYPKHPDYISNLSGATLNGRALEPLPFDGRRLGEGFNLLRPPIPEFTVLGGMMVDRTDINHLLAMTKSWPSFKHSVRIVLRHLMDRVSHTRGTRLVMGNALVARLLYSLQQRGNVTLAMETEVSECHTQDNKANGVRSVVGLTLRSNGNSRRVHAKGGVLLASGGFNRHPVLRAQLLPGIPPEWCPAAPGHTGQMHDLAMGLGARYAEGGMSPAFWAPVSLRKRADGSTAAFPHFVMDRAKPGMITVNQAGERFLNESTSYHLFGLAMQEAHQVSPAIPAYLVCDAEALRKYGLGMVRPGGKGLERFLSDGYLVRGETLENLAFQLGMDPAKLRHSVEQMNAYADAGQDPDFGRGATAYQQNLGDPNAPGPNPCLGPLRQAPFYAVRLYPGDIGASTGLATDEHARVLGPGGTAIAGLYAVGNDMQSIMGGAYPAPGITIGPGLVFAYLASRHAAHRASA
jgi:succinate dehydrogenase/fumarate reductase flavoprotein subunit